MLSSQIQALRIAGRVISTISDFSEHTPKNPDKIYKSSVIYSSLFSGFYFTQPCVRCWKAGFLGLILFPPNENEVTESGLQSPRDLGLNFTSAFYLLI